MNFKFKPVANTSMYLFGSSVFSEKYNDIDIAVIYNKHCIDIQELLQYRIYIKKEVLKEFNCSCDVILLSEEEDDEMQFLYNAKTKKIY
ncbi:MAG: nucleotidyltransferase domain-containing protein [Marinifilaceae bacterium]|nr:nucleotidyltransferase domain-containing protein [Marinifilaceae bacterium]